MNANELAEQFEKHWGDFSSEVAAYMLAAATMLRQQQAEIEALRKSHIELERGIVKDLNQRQSAEPVAWMREDGVIAFHKQKEVDSQGYKWQPLYTHPVKELTEYMKYRLAVKEFGEGFCITYRSELLAYADAILRKAQE